MRIVREPEEPETRNDCFERDRRVRIGLLFFRFGWGGHFEVGGEGVAPAAVLVAELTDGDTDGVVSFGKLGEALVDGVGEDGPEVFLGGGVERVGGDEEHFVIYGKSFFAGLRQGQELGLASGGEDGVGSWIQCRSRSRSAIGKDS